MSTPQERERWEKLRRALLAVVAQTRDMIPDAQFTLDIRIIPKPVESATRPPR